MSSLWVEYNISERHHLRKTLTEDFVYQNHIVQNEGQCELFYCDLLCWFFGTDCASSIYTLGRLISKPFHVINQVMR